MERIDDTREAHDTRDTHGGDAMHFVVSEGVVPEGSRKIRHEVFQLEQGFEVEFDEKDAESVHVLLLDGDVPVATCRVFSADDDPATWVLGRLCVAREMRGRGLGPMTLRRAEQVARDHGAARMTLHAQVHARGMYEASGYVATSGVDYEDEGSPHYWMSREL